MKASKFWLALPLTAALLSVSTAASAQSAGLIVVNVDLRNARILNNLARDLSVNVSDIPITVQAPVNVAAIVCQIDATILAQSFNRGGSSCYAQQTSSQLNRIVRRVMNLQQ